MWRAWFFSIVVVFAAFVALNWHRMGPLLLGPPTDDTLPYVTPSASVPLAGAPGSSTQATSASPSAAATRSTASNAAAASNTADASTEAIPPTASPPPAPVATRPVPVTSDKASSDRPSSDMPSSDRGPSDEAASDPAQGQVPPATNPEQTRTLLAESLASASDDALAQVKPETLERIAEALEQTPGKPDASNGGTSTGSSTADSNTNEVQITALTPPPPPTALPPSGEAPSASASVKPQPPAAEQPPASRKRVLDAPATDLAAVPVLLLAKALSDIDTARLSADEPVPLPSAITAARQEIKLDADARRFVAELTRPSLRPIKIAQADHFVSADQRLDLGLKALPPVKTLDELLAEGGDDDRPVTRVRITHRLEPIQPADLLVQATRSPGAPIRILEQEQITEIPLSEALRRHRLQPSAPIVSVREVQVLEPTTLGELKALAKVKPEELPRVIAGTPGATYRTVEELLGLADRESDSLYYVRTVQPDDVQGIWGIIQSGLIDNFARGMAIARGDQVNTYRVHIPRLADEPLADNSGSSFLGRMIFRKMRRSTIYNIKLGRIATTPENIRPGQQIIIVDFTPEELIAIYRHFARTAS